MNALIDSCGRSTCSLRPSLEMGLRARRWPSLSKNGAAGRILRDARPYSHRALVTVTPEGPTTPNLLSSMTKSVYSGTCSGRRSESGSGVFVARWDERSSSCPKRATALASSMSKSLSRPSRALGTLLGGRILEVGRGNSLTRGQVVVDRQGAVTSSAEGPSNPDWPNCCQTLPVAGCRA